MNKSYLKENQYEINLFFQSMKESVQANIDNQGFDDSWLLELFNNFNIFLNIEFDIDILIKDNFENKIRINITKLNDISKYINDIQEIRDCYINKLNFKNDELTEFEVLQIIRIFSKIVKDDNYNGFYFKNYRRK